MEQPEPRGFVNVFPLFFSLSTYDCLLTLPSAFIYCEPFLEIKVKRPVCEIINERAVLAMDENMSSTESEDGEGLESLFSDDSSFYGSTHSFLLSEFTS